MLQGALASAWLAASAGRDSTRSNGTRRSRSMAGGTDGGLVADDDDRGEPVERRRLDVGQDRQEIDAAEAGRAGQHLGARAARRCRRPRRRDSACSRRRRWRPAARRRNREWDRPARWAATAPPDRPARRRDRPGPARRAPNSRAVRRSSASARRGGRPAPPAFPRRCRRAGSRRRRRDGQAACGAETTASLFHLKASLDALTRHGACSTRALPADASDPAGGGDSIAMSFDFRSEISQISLVSPRGRGGRE